MGCDIIAFLSFVARTHHKGMTHYEKAKTLKEAEKDFGFTVSILAGGGGRVSPLHLNCDHREIGAVPCLVILR